MHKKNVEKILICLLTVPSITSAQTIKETAIINKIKRDTDGIATVHLTSEDGKEKSYIINCDKIGSIKEGDVIDCVVINNTIVKKKLNFATVLERNYGDERKKIEETIDDILDEVEEFIRK